MDMAAAMGIEMLTEDQYRALQKIEDVDMKTSGWVQTPTDIRNRGGALFCDKRYGHVFTYHNGRSEERRVGKECRSRLRSGPYHEIISQDQSSIYHTL